MITAIDQESLRAQMESWRRQIGHRYRIASERGPRPFAVISYLLHKPIANERRVDLRRLLLVALFDEWLDCGEMATRLVGVAGSVTSNGLRFGGSDLSRFDKNLRLAPTAGGGGARLDAADDNLLEFALSLERYLERCARHPYFPRRREPQLPVLAACRDGFGAVDLSAFPKRQIVAIASPARDLCGRCGTTQFDFYHTRFRVAR